jgi:hypothetical protein
LLRRFRSGTIGLLQLLSMSLPSCCRFHPARVFRRISQIATLHAAFALQLRARPLGLLTFEATSAFTFVTARRLAITPWMMSSIGFRNLVTLLPAIQATGL